MPPLRKNMGLERKAVESDPKLREAVLFVEEWTQFILWMESLDKQTKNNFITLVSLPDAEKVLQKCPDPLLKKWSLFAIKTRREDTAGKYLDYFHTLDTREQTKGEKVKHVKKAGQDRDHHCHWPGCGKQVPPAKWGCYQHWMMLPKRFRDAIWSAYRVGQEVKRTPSRDYVKVAREVQDWIKERYNEDGSRKKA